MFLNISNENDIFWIFFRYNLEIKSVICMNIDKIEPERIIGDILMENLSSK